MPSMVCIVWQMAAAVHDFAWTDLVLAIIAAFRKFYLDSVTYNILWFLSVCSAGIGCDTVAD